jgi:hypothetical protein
MGICIIYISDVRSNKCQVNVNSTYCTVWQSGLRQHYPSKRRVALAQPHGVTQRHTARTAAVCLSVAQLHNVPASLSSEQSNPQNYIKEEREVHYGNVFLIFLSLLYIFLKCAHPQI